MKHRLTLFALACCLALGLAPASFAADVVHRGRFVEKGHPVDGGVRVERDAGRLVLVLEADFVAKPGPDLALFLAPRPVGQLDNRDATRGALRVAPLRQARGAQRYPLPADVDLARYRSVILHSESFSKLWGGADLR